MKKGITAMCNPSDNKMAGATRLELATSGVTGRRSNQLSYAPVSFVGLPHQNQHKSTELVGGTGLEPVALGL
jgi:hypothetical protein